MAAFRFENPVIESWEEDSETVIFGDDLLEEMSSPWNECSETVILGDQFLEDVEESVEHRARAVLRRSSIPPPPLPQLRTSRPPPPPRRSEMPTPVMLIEPGLEAIRPESRPPALAEGHVDVAIPPAPPLPRQLDARPVYSKAQSRRPTGESNMDTLRPMVASTSAPVESELPALASIAKSLRWVGARVGRGTEATKTYLAESFPEAWARTESLLNSARDTWGLVLAPRFARATSSLFSPRAAAGVLLLALGAFLLLAITPEPREEVNASALPAPPPPVEVDIDANSTTTSLDDLPLAEETEPEESAHVDMATRAVATKAESTEAEDRELLAKLEKREPTSLSREEVELIAATRERMDRRAAKATVESLAKKRKITLADKELFLSHAGNQRTYRTALLEMAKSKSWLGPDLIYSAMRRYRSQKDIADFAHALLLTPHSYKYASPALTVVIDAETLTECSDVRQLAERALEDGDNRAVRHMAKFASTTGCGKSGAQDCYPCLRGDQLLVDALKAAKLRRPPL